MTVAGSEQAFERARRQNERAVWRDLRNRIRDHAQLIASGRAKEARDRLEELDVSRARDLQPVREAFIEISKQMPDEFEAESRDERRPDDSGLVLRGMEKGAPMCIYFAGTGTLVSEMLVQAYCQDRGISMVFASGLGRSLYKRVTIETFNEQLDAMCASFKALIDEYKPSSVTVVAGSRYSMLAAIIAPRINPDKLLVASPVTHLPASGNEDRGDSDAGVALVEHMRAMLPTELQDMLTCLKDWSKTNKLHIVYSTTTRADVRNSQRMQGLENVKLYPQTGWPSHDTMPLMLSTGLLSDVVKG